MKKKKSVIVAMSGGVDSSVAAALLKKEGYEVAGITMCFNLDAAAGRRPACCGKDAVNDARSVARKLGIRHYVLNMRKALDKYVIDDFCREYLAGRTPNPCVRCNQYIKFGALLKRARMLGAEYLATGHYARIEEVISHQSPVISKKYLLKKGADKKKDQSYFLYRLAQKQLRHILFPIGGYNKEEVRGLAREFGLPVAEKKGSQEICFLPAGGYRDFLAACAADRIKPGPVVDSKGKVIGMHKGAAFYTVGQRQGLGIAAGVPLYITAIDAGNNRLTVGPKKEALGKEFLVRGTNFILNKPKKKIAVKVKIRYNHKEVSALLRPSGRGFKARLNKPQFAVTPGQSAVFYEGDTVLGGGIIEKATV